VDVREAVITVLREEGTGMHWTVIQDLALRRGYLDPFTQRDIRHSLLRELATLSKEGVVTKRSTGVYELARAGDDVR
jgi:hypothetical protein